MEWHTFEEWGDLGFVVCQGEKSTRRNSQGIAIFSEEQVVEACCEYEDVFGGL